MTCDQLEDLAGARGRELKRQLLQDHPGLRALREEQALPAQGGARRVARRSRAGHGHGRGLATVSGPVTVRRLAFRAPGRASACPAGAALSLPKGWHSHGLARLAVREAVRGSCDTAMAAIGARCGPAAGKRQVEELVKAAAVDTGGCCARRVPVPRTSEVLLVHGADGKGIVTKPGCASTATGCRPSEHRR